VIGKEDVELLNAKQVSKVLRVSQSLIYAMADRGQLPCVRWDCPSQDGKRKKSVVRFDLNDIVAFVDSHRQRKS